MLIDPFGTGNAYLCDFAFYVYFVKPCNFFS